MFPSVFSKPKENQDSLLMRYWKEFANNLSDDAAYREFLKKEFRIFAGNLKMHRVIFKY